MTDIEDFLTYTEIDDSSFLTQTSERSTWTNIRRDTPLTVLYKDFGLGHFVDFEHTLDLRISAQDSMPDGNYYLSPYAVVDSALNSPYGNIAVYVVGRGSTSIYALRCRLGDGQTRIFSTDFDVGTTYYLTVKRNADSTAGVYVYSNATRTSLIESEESPGVTLAGHGFIQAPHKVEYGSYTTVKSTGYVENLNLGEVTSSFLTRRVSLDCDLGERELPRRTSMEIELQTWLFPWKWRKQVNIKGSSGAGEDYRKKIRICWDDSKIRLLEHMRSLTWSGGGHEFDTYDGVCFDDSGYVYGDGGGGSEEWVTKFNKTTGAYVDVSPAVPDCSYPDGDDPGDICFYDDYIYLICGSYAAGGDGGYGKVWKINKTLDNWIAVKVISSDVPLYYSPSSIDYYDGKFWVSLHHLDNSDVAKVIEYTTSFSKIETHDLTTVGVQGIAWRDGSLYVNSTVTEVGVSSVMCCKYTNWSMVQIGHGTWGGIGFDPDTGLLWRSPSNHPNVAKRGCDIYSTPPRSEISVNQKSRSDFADVRICVDNVYVIAGNGNGFIEEIVESDHVDIWFKDPKDLSSDSEIYVYYGNENASIFSENLDDTFLFADDFETDLSKWTLDQGGGSITRETSPTPPQGSYLVKVLDNSGSDEVSMKKTGFSSDHYAIHMKARVDATNSFWEPHVHFINHFWDRRTRIYFDSDGKLKFYSNQETELLTYQSGSWYEIVATARSQVMDIYIREIGFGDFPDQLRLMRYGQQMFASDESETGILSRTAVGTTATGFADTVILRRIVEPEPYYLIAGDELPGYLTRRVSMQAEIPTTSYLTRRLSALIERQSFLSRRLSLQVERDSFLSRRSSLQGERESVATRRMSLSTERVSASLRRATSQIEEVSPLSRRISLDSERTSFAERRASLDIERTSVSLRRATADLEITDYSTRRTSLESEYISTILRRLSLEIETKSFLQRKLSLSSERITYLSRRAYIDVEKDSFLSRRLALDVERIEHFMSKASLKTEMTSSLMTRGSLENEVSSFLLRRSSLDIEKDSFSMKRSSLDTEHVSYLMRKISTSVEISSTLMTRMSLDSEMTSYVSRRLSIEVENESYLLRRMSMATERYSFTSRRISSETEAISFLSRRISASLEIPSFHLIHISMESEFGFRIVSITVDPSSVKRSGTNTTTLRCDFHDEEDLSQGSYVCKFFITKNGLTYGPYWSSPVVKEGSKEYHAEYSLDPDSEELGLYDVKAVVIKVGT